MIKNSITLLLASSASLGVEAVTHQKWYKKANAVFSAAKDYADDTVVGFN